MLKNRRFLLAGVLLTVVVAGSALFAQARAGAPPPPVQARPAAPAAGHVTSPKEEWGHNVGDDYFLANYQQLVAYWRKLERESNRLHVIDMGKTAEGRPMLLGIITAPANYAKIDRYKEISARLANAEGACARRQVGRLD
jgi:hypothetical protein